MILLELVAQGAAGLSPQVRAALRTGYNVLVPAAGQSPALTELSTALFYPDARGGDAALAAPGAKQPRFGATFIARDGKTYRLIRELGGASALHRLEAGSFKLVSQDTVEIGQYLTASLGMPTRTQFATIFCFSPRTVPSRIKPATTSAVAPKPAASPRMMPSSALAAAAAPASAVEPAQARARIAELRKEAAQSRQVQELQFQLDGLQNRMFQADEKLKLLAALEADRAAAKKFVDQAPSPEKLGLSADIVDHARHYADRARQRDEALKKIEVDRAKVDDAPAGPVEPVWRHRHFLAAIGAGVLAVIVAFALRHTPGRYLALVDIFAFGYAALMALRYVGELQAGTTTGRRRSRIEERERKIRDQFEIDVAAVRAAMTTVGVDSPEELIDVFGKRELSEAKLREVADQIAQAQRDPQVATARSEKARIEVEVERLEGQLAGYGGGYVRDARDVEAEIARLEGSIAAAERGEAPGAPPPMAPLGGSFASAPAASAGSEADDPSPRLFTLAADVLQADVATLSAALKDRVSQYVFALSDQRYSKTQFDARGRATLAAPGRTLAGGDLPPADRDLLFAAIKLAIAEKHASAGKIPLVLDDLFAGASDAKRQLVSRMLKHIGTMTQVVHVTGHAAHKGLADATAGL